MQRRRFLQSTAAFVAATQARPVLGANDRVELAVVGIGGRGRDHIENFADLPNARIAAICDVNQAARERGQALVRKIQGHTPKAYNDQRELLDDASIQAVSIATPNHWHALSTVWACEAGKDVYVEKPASHNPYESRRMIEAARKHGRMVQVGSQSRSIGHKRDAIERLRSGVIGDVYMARGLCYRRRYSIGVTPEEPVPAGLDWDLFLGPAPKRAYTENRFDYNWHWFWDTGNGDIGNQGVHELDVARWGLGLDAETRPAFASSTGGKFIWKDDQETPNTQQATFDYDAGQIVFDVRNLNTGTESRIPMGKSLTGNLFYGDKGFAILHPEGFQVFLGDEREKTVDEGIQEEKVWDVRPHMANFLAAVASRDKGQLHAEIAIGAAAADLCHYANASYRTGRRLAVDSVTGLVPGDTAANEMLQYEGRRGYRI